jgi:hypothetical protein
MMNKKGQEMSTNTIILIILGLIILVILALGFSLGWDKILPFIKQDNNVKEVVSACQIACTQQSVYDFCTKKLDLKVGKDTFKESCTEFAANPDYGEYGIATCPGLPCP